MILVYALRDFTTPNPASAEFVAISPFVKENVTGEEHQFLYLVLSRLDVLDLSKV
jgi:hypothetical protein